MFSLPRCSALCTRQKDAAEMPGKARKQQDYSVFLLPILQKCEQLCGKNRNRVTLYAAPSHWMRLVSSISCM